MRLGVLRSSGWPDRGKTRLNVGLMGLGYN
jgi:hypothetical protein